ncbi:lipopolysaccharide-modifying enzyme [Dasineura jujubifolia toursvirus 2a]|nr:lipopolysaccharide-modifying enzyme [Dasineura jujubifolia toursvirus 2a]
MEYNINTTNKSEKNDINIKDLHRYVYLPTKKKIPLPKDNYFVDDITGDILLDNLNLFRSDSYEDVIQTLDYIMDRYGKILFVKIVDNKLVTFTSIINNEYYPYWRKDNEVNKDPFEFLRKGYIELDEDYNCYVDGYVVKNFDNFDNYDNKINWIRSLLEKLCENRQISDCEFFINYSRETPIITKNNSIADYHVGKIYMLDNRVNLKQHTVFSFSTSDRFKDIAFPTLTDYERLYSNQFGIEYFRSMKWVDKIDGFLYRGTALSEPTQNDILNSENISTPRLNLVNFMKTNYPNKSNVGITDFCIDVPIIIDNRVYYLKKLNNLKPEEDVELISKYKFIFCLDGICSPKELSYLMFTGSCIIRQKSTWKTWFDDFIDKDCFVYVKSDLSDLNEVVEWCINNDEECKQIGLNARNFAVKYLSTNGVLDYMQCIMNNYSRNINYKSLYENKNKFYETIQKEYQLSFIENYMVTFRKLPWENKLVVPIEYPQNNFNDYEWNMGLLMFLERNSYSDKKVTMDVFNNTFFTDVYDYDNIVEGINDAFVGLNVINNLTKEVPNFSFTYGAKQVGDKYIIIKENIISNSYETVSLETYIKTMNTDKIPSDILIQIFCALQLAFERNVFVHGNLNLNKIYIRNLPVHRTIVYRLAEKNWAINTKRLVIITDFSKSTVLTNFDSFNYKPKRMFVGNNIEKIVDSSSNNNEVNDFMLHVKGDRDIKYVMKKIGKKVLRGVIDADKVTTGVNEPISMMSQVVKKEDIANDKIRFGAVKDIDLEDIPQNPRLVYDTLSGIVKPHKEVVNRVMLNPLPSDQTSMGNIVLQYEITQCIKSSLANLNMKFSVDVLTKESLENCIEFIKNYYNNVINNTIETIIEDFTNVNTKDDIWNLRIFIKKYIVPILQSKYSQIFLQKIKDFVYTKIKDSIKIGLDNTKEFYNEYKNM